MRSLVPAAETVKLWRPAALDGAEVLHASHSPRPWRWYHDAYGFWIMLGGHTEWSNRGATRVATTGVLMMMEPGEVHTARMVHRPACFRLLLVSRARFRSALRQAGLPQRLLHLAATQVRDPGLFDALERLHQSLERVDAIPDQQGYLAECLDGIVRGYAASGPAGERATRRSEAVRRALAYLHAHVTEGASLDELAEAAKASKFRLLRTFHHEVGLPPHAYLTQVRLARARSLLAEGQPIVQVALATGFSDQAHLTRQFKQVAGVTPGQYLRDSREERGRVLALG